MGNVVTWPSQEKSNSLIGQLGLGPLWPEVLELRKGGLQREYWKAMDDGLASGLAPRAPKRLDEVKLIL